MVFGILFCLLKSFSAAWYLEKPDSLSSCIACGCGFFAFAFVFCFVFVFKEG